MVPRMAGRAEVPFQSPEQITKFGTRSTVAASDTFPAERQPSARQAQLEQRREATRAAAEQEIKEMRRDPRWSDSIAGEIRAAAIRLKHSARGWYTVESERSL
jgi:hypothetical protein